LTVIPDITFYRDISRTVHISVMLTENSIVDAQLSNNGTIPDYIHKHVLREMLTNVAGNPITETTVSASPVSLQFTTQLPTTWVAENVSAVVSVHYPSPDYSVLQAEETKIND